MDIKKAFAVSFLSHCLILIPLGSLGIFLPEKKPSQIKITYYQTKPPEIKLRPETKIKKQDVVKISQDTKPEPAVKKEEPPAKVDNVKIVAPVKKQRPVRRAKKDQNLSRAPMTAKISLPKEGSAAESIPGTTLPNTPQCLDYYNYIREEIRRSLEKIYMKDYEEGRISVTFTLGQTGKLIKLEINEESSTADPFLHSIAYESIKSASPFKAFPKGVEMDQISFNLTIVFKKDDV